MMKKLIVKTSIFVIPFMLLSLASFLLYPTDKGDLLRIGYVMDDLVYDRMIVFKDDFQSLINYKTLKDIDLNKKQEFTALTIGDSFSEQGSVGYQQYLTAKGHASVLHYNFIGLANPIDIAYGILNGNLLDSIKIKYIILESAERLFVYRSTKLDSTKIIDKGKLEKDLKNLKTDFSHLTKKRFFSDRTFRFPAYSLYYNFDDNAFYSQTYIVPINKKLFSSASNKLLFFADDLSRMKLNDEVRVRDLNDKLNSLSKKLLGKGIKLIVVPCPDKYDAYYEYIIDKTPYPKPLFFELFNNLNKEYLYVDSKTIINSAIQKESDVYFYDDTHWSPIAAKLIANEIDKLIVENN